MPALVYANIHCILGYIHFKNEVSGFGQVKIVPVSKTEKKKKASSAVPSLFLSEVCHEISTNILAT